MNNADKEKCKYKRLYITHTLTHTLTHMHIIIHPPDRGGAGSSEGAQRELGLSGKYCRPKFSFFEGRRLANFAEGSHDDGRPQPFVDRTWDVRTSVEDGRGGWAG